MESALRSPSPDGSPGCSTPEADDQIDEPESSGDEEQPLYITRGGRRIFAEDIEAEVASGRFAMLGASSASRSSSSSACWDYFVAADSGFGSVALACAGFKYRVCFVCSVKQAHKKFPKDEIDRIMKDAPGGKWVTCEAEIEGVWIVCAGYKYGSKKVLYFCWPKGAAQCVPGEPYIASYVDHAGNRAERPVQRLSVLSRYFHFSNTVDVHNQMRQDILDIEYTWVTQNCWFRLYSTLFGMSVTDAYIVYKARLSDDHPDKKMSLMQFADQLAVAMLQNKEVEIDTPVMTRRRALEPPRDDTPSGEHILSSYGMASQRPGWNGTKDYARQFSCVECAREGKHKVKTTFFCSGPRCGEKFAVCREGASHGRTCFEKHKEFSNDEPAFLGKAKTQTRRGAAKRARWARASCGGADDGEGAEV
jgi:hypothetical protein